jgi:hypothetical protein
MSEEFSFKDWASQGIEGVRSKIHFPKTGLVPAEFREHMRASRVQFWKAWRSLFDTVIERLEKPQTPRSKTSIKNE